MPVSVEPTTRLTPPQGNITVSSEPQPPANSGIERVAQTALSTVSNPTSCLSKRSIKTIDENQQIFLYAVKKSTDLSKFASSDIYRVIKHAISRCETSALQEEEKEEICQLFDRLGHLPAQSWDRMRNLSGQKALQRVISPELDALYTRLELDASQASNEHFQIQMSIAKAMLSTSLGVGIHKTAAGVNGAQMIKSLEGEIVGVFKPERKGSWFDIIGMIKRFFGQARLLCSARLSQEYAEVAAHKLSHALGFDITPAAQMCTIRNQEGAFLAFLKGYKEAKDVVETMEAKKAYTANELTLFQKMAAYDFLSGNMDCHDENWFVRMKGDEITEIRVIDHGNSFIESNPAPMSSLGNQYKWGRLKISQESFTAEFVSFIKSMTKQGLESFIQETRSQFLNTKMEALIRERFWTLRAGVIAGKISCPGDLSRLHTDHDFATCRNEIIRKLQSEAQPEAELLVVDFKVKK